MNGIAIRPRMMNVGIATPAIQGSKYSSISCKPRKYQGAFAGFIVIAAFAGSSSGALIESAQTSRITVTMIAARSSTRSR